MTTTRARAVARTPDQVHTLFADYVTARDVDGMISLFEPDAVLLADSGGAEARGAEQLRAACDSLCGPDTRLDVRTDAVHVKGELALASSTWTATTAAGQTTRAGARQVVRRQPDGRWLLVIVEPAWGVS